MVRVRILGFSAVATCAFALSACGGGSGGGGSSVLAPPTATPGPPGKRYPQIDHVVIIVQENRSVDNLFQGFPGADTQSYGLNRQGEKIALLPVKLEAPFDFEHDSTTFLSACDGRGSYPGTNCGMNGFDAGTGPAESPDTRPAPTPTLRIASCLTTKRSRYFSSAKTTSLQTRCFRRISIRAVSSRINTSSRRKRLPP